MSMEHEDWRAHTQPLSRRIAVISVTIVGLSESIHQFDMADRQHHGKHNLETTYDSPPVADVASIRIGDLRLDPQGRKLLLEELAAAKVDFWLEHLLQTCLRDCASAFGAQCRLETCKAR